MHFPADTIAAPATPPGRGALALIRLSGPLAPVILDKLGAGRSVEHPRTALLVRLSHDGVDIDDCLATFFPRPGSYTGEDLAEISCHGNPLLVRRILEALHALGARPARPGEFTQRAFLNGKLDLTQAEAVADLIAAQTDLAVRAARAAQAGTLRKQIDALRETLIESLAHIEAHIDFPDEDIQPRTRTDLGARLQARREIIRRLLATAGAGRLLREGIRCALVGPPNAGKSSLLNALAGRDRAIVSEIPGTTRDTVEEWIAIEGMPFHLIDTAGLRDSADAVEKEGVRRSLEARDTADLILFLFDGSVPWSPENEALACECDPARTLFIANKSDLPRGTEREALRLSAKTGEGLDVLRAELARRALRGEAPSESGVAINARQESCLRRALTPLEAAIQGLEQNRELELVSVELRDALHAIEDVTGATTTDDILDKLFASFCIGK